MKSFKSFIAEGKIPSEVAARNEQIDIEAVVRDAVKEFHGMDDAAIKAITDYMRPKKVFSLGKMIDDLPYGAGAMKAAIEAVKKAASTAGFGKTGGGSKPQTQAQRIDTYLKQKHIGPIKR